MNKKVRGIIKKYNPQSKLLFLDEKIFSLKHFPSEITKNLKEQLEVELILDRKNNVIDIKILGDIPKQEKQQKELTQISHKKKTSNEVFYKNGIYITPKYLLQYLGEEINNFYLRLNKYIFASVENPKKQSVPQDYNEAFDLFKDGELKLKIENIPNITSFPNTNEVKDFINLYIKTIKDLENKGIYNIESQNFKSNSKFIIGLGHPSAYEVSITLHHIYGFPYISGQAIKGVLRNYFINEFFDLNEKERLEIAKEELKKDNIEDIDNLDKEERKKVYNKIGEEKEKLASKNPIFKFIFGTQKEEGNIIFFDAMPKGNIKLEIDIMNNHFPEYYEDDKNETPPADWQNPKPIKFLVVKDTKFQVFVGIKRNIDIKSKIEKLGENENLNDIRHSNFFKEFENSLDNKNEFLKSLLKHLENAFKLYGIGAKTSVGYGYLENE